MWVHEAISYVAEQLEDGEHVFAYLDVYVIAAPGCVREAYDLLSDTLQEPAGIQLHTGKTRVWNRAGECLDGFADLGADVWNPEGVKVLGTLVG